VIKATMPVVNGWELRLEFRAVLIYDYERFCTNILDAET